MDALAAGNAWAVGWYYDTGFVAESLVLHWTGASWVKTDVPNPGTGLNQLYGVGASSPTDVWAVGTTTNTGDPRGSRHPLALHHNGTDWSTVPMPDTASGSALLRSVTAISPTDASAVGSQSGYSQPVAYHWNGTAWALVPTPAVGSAGGTTSSTGSPRWTPVGSGPSAIGAGLPADRNRSWRDGTAAAGRSRRPRPNRSVAQHKESRRSLGRPAPPMFGSRAIAPSSRTAPTPTGPLPCAGLGASAACHEMCGPEQTASAPSHIAGTEEHLAAIGRWGGMTAGAFESIAEFDSVNPTDLLIADRVTTEARIVSLERDWTGIVESSAMTSTDDEHDPEGATIAFERAQIETLIEVAREHLDEIEDALERVRTGAYGTCQDCGQPIAAARLEARPYATTCISCASRRR